MKIQELAQLWNMSEDELNTMIKSIIGEDATPEEIEVAVMDIMGSLQSTLSDPHTLHQCLSFMSMEDLSDLLTTLGNTPTGQPSKEDMIARLHDMLTAPDHMIQVYPWLSNGEVDILKQMCVTNVPLVSTDIIFYVSELIRYGLCYLDQYGKHLLFPEDLKNTFLVAQAEPTLQAKQRENAAIYSICAAAVYYFGVYPISMLQSKIQQATGKAMTEQDLILWHNTSIMPRDEFFFKNGYVISGALHQTPEDVVALQQIQKMKKLHFWPTPEALFTLSMEQWLIDDDVYTDFWDLAPYMMDNEFGDIMSVSRFVEASIRTGAPFDALMGYLSEQIFAFDTDEQIDAFIQIMKRLWDNTPMWENCGYSLAQVQAGVPQKNAEQKKESAKGKVISLAEHRAKKNM